MGKLKLGFITSVNERTAPLVDGRIAVEGLELVPTRSDPSETFWRQLRFQEFEISEMSLSSYLIARAHGMDMMAIPAFPARRFMQNQLYYHVESGIRTAADLVGKRLAVGEYQQTAALWVRGTLEHDFGVSQYKVHWFMERSEELSHGGATQFTPPEGISFQRIPSDRSMASMLVNREIDAAPVSRAFGSASNMIDRSTQIRAKEGDWSKVKLLFPDRIAEGKRFFDKHGFIPANHTYVMRGDVYRKYPWVAINLYQAFLAAKSMGEKEAYEKLPNGLVFGADYLAKTRELFGPDPFPYGIKPNRHMLEELISYSHEQGLIPEKPKLEDLFAESTLDL